MPFIDGDSVVTDRRRSPIDNFGDADGVSDSASEGTDDVIFASRCDLSTGSCLKINRSICMHAKRANRTTHGRPSIN